MFVLLLKKFLWSERGPIEYESIRVIHGTQILLVRVGLGVIAMKRYSTYPRSPKLKPHHQMLFNFITRKRLFCVGGDLTAL